MTILLELLVLLIAGPHVHFPGSEPGCKVFCGTAHRQPFSIAHVGVLITRPRRLFKGRAVFY